MTIEFILFGLRIASGVLLTLVLLAFFVVLWRDYRSAAYYADNTKREYGKLERLQRLDDLYAPTGENYPLLPITSLGRAPTNTVVIADSFASSEHASIAFRRGQWWLEDRNSRNGTLLNGERISSPVIVTDGDVISVGSNDFRIRLD